ncbi:MAG: hypothetical protein HZC55_10990 [Verrucomicrobia bacterium]|nr:hypothetical protein [Verrucomicrobiota bacterium]
MIRRLLLCLVAGGAGAVPGGAAAEPRPVLVQSAPGRFEVAASDPTVAHAVAAAAEEAWAHLAQPLDLPAAFSSPVFVRVSDRGDASLTDAPHRAVVEPGGVVTLRLPFGAWQDGSLHRALIHGLLTRLGVAWFGGSVVPVVPRWLEVACAAWWETRLNPAQFDAWRQRAAGTTPPGIAAILDWRREGPPPLRAREGALGLFLFLQAESGRDGEWLHLVRRLLAGMDPQAALAACYPGRFHGVEAREFWWQTGWHHHSRVRALPVIEAAESRWLLSALARFVFAGPEASVDRLLPLAAVLERRAEPLVAAEIARRAAELERLVPALHPFYRNAGLSLAEALGSGAGPKEAAKIAARCAAFAQDWKAGLDLEAAANAALDALESRSAGRDGSDPG